MKSGEFRLYFNRFGHKRCDHDVWVIVTPSHMYHARSVTIKVTVRTIYRGDTAPQPRAYLTGIGSVRVIGNRAFIE